MTWRYRYRDLSFSPHPSPPPNARPVEATVPIGTAEPLAAPVAVQSGVGEEAAPNSALTPRKKGLLKDASNRRWLLDTGVSYTASWSTAPWKPTLRTTTGWVALLLFLGALHMLSLRWQVEQMAEGTVRSVPCRGVSSALSWRVATHSPALGHH